MMMTPKAAQKRITGPNNSRAVGYGLQRLVFHAVVLHALLVRAPAALVPANDRPQRQRLWQALDQPDQARAWKSVFGETGERGEYMDGYSESAMFDRCEQDYKWAKKFSPDAFLSERAKMVRASSIHSIIPSI